VAKPTKHLSGKQVQFFCALVGFPPMDPSASHLVFCLKSEGSRKNRVTESTVMLRVHLLDGQTTETAKYVPLLVSRDGNKKRDRKEKERPTTIQTKQGSTGSTVFFLQQLLARNCSLSLKQRRNLAEQKWRKNECKQHNERCRSIVLMDCWE
jgi:hypothetical protein